MPKMIKASLTSSYGYFDRETGTRTYYGPGKDIDIPEGLARTLGLVMEEEEAEFETANDSEFEGVVEETEEEVFGWDSARMIPAEEPMIDDVITDSLLDDVTGETEAELLGPFTIDQVLPPETEIPEDYPGYKYLIAAGYGSIEEVNALTYDDLMAIDGIGKITATAIIDRRQEQ